jgi:hypothetical protein
MLIGMLMAIAIYSIIGGGGILLGAGAGYWFAKTRNASIRTYVLVGGLIGLILAMIAAALPILLSTR